MRIIANLYILSALVLLSCSYSSHTYAKDGYTLTVDGSVNSIILSHDNKFLYVSTGPYGQSDLPKIKNFGVNIYRKNGNLKFKKIGFISTGLGKILAADGDLLIVHRKILPTSFGELKNKYKPSIKLISIKDPSNPREIGQVAAEGYKSATSIERKLIALSDGKKVSLVSYANMRRPRVVSDFSPTEKCISSYGGRKGKIESIAFSKRGHEIHFLLNNRTLCSYGLTSIAEPTLLRGGYVAFGTKILSGDKLLLLIGGRSTIVHRNITGASKYDLNEYYDVVNNFEINKYSNSETYSFDKYLLNKNYLIVSAKRFGSKPYRFAVYDIKDRHQPKLVEEYKNPDKYYVRVLSASSDMKYLVTGLNKKITFLPLIKGAISTPDEINIAHKKALDLYTQSPGKKSAIDAVNLMNKAGLDKLLNNRNTAITSDFQAHIVNDYGYFLLQAGNYEKSLEYLLSAIKYHYERPSAHYNLAEYYSLKLAGNSENSKEKLLSRIRTHCSYYEKLVGKLNNCGGKLYVPTKVENADKSICKYVRKVVMDNQFRKIVIQDSKIDINNDGILDSVVKTVAGTAHIESIGVFDNERSLVYSPRGVTDSNGPVAFQQDIVPYRGYYYFVFHDSGIPVQILRSNSDYSEKLVCTVNSVTREPYLKKGSDKALCKNLPTSNAQGSEINANELSVATREIHPYRVLDIDFNNDGSKEKIVKISFSGIGGAGCEANWDDVLNTNGKFDVSHPERSLLLDLQNTDYSSRYPAKCGKMSTRWIKHLGSTLLDRTFFGNHRWSSEMYRRVHMIKNGNSELMCEFGHKIVLQY